MITSRPASARTCTSADPPLTAGHPTAGWPSTLAPRPPDPADRTGDHATKPARHDLPLHRRLAPMQQVTKRFMNWASILETNTRAQAEMTSSMPFIHPHLALMPDAHLGKGATVGSVIPTLGAIIPAAVGVDIGCGMIAVRTQFSLDQVPADRRAAAGGDRGGGAVVGGQVQRRGRRVGTRRTASPARAACREGRVRPRVVRRQLAAAARDPRVGQPLHRGLRRRAGPGVAVPALGLARGRQQDRPAPHQGRAA